MGSDFSRCTDSQTDSPTKAAVSYTKMASSAQNQIPDLELLILRWAKEMFDATKNKEQGRIPKEFLQFNINWSRVRFHFGDPTYDMIPWMASDSRKGGAASGANAPKIQPQVLFKTIFRNSTNQEQEYSFKTERTTRSAATVIIEKGFSRGMEFSLGLKLPEEIAEANAGFKREVSLVNIGEDTIEEEMTWGVDNLVKVPPNTETVAELVITEAQRQGSFKMETRFNGRVIVTVTNLRENNELVTIIEGDVKDILTRELQRGLSGFRIVDGQVCVETRGTCNFKYGVEQKIKLAQRPMGNEDDF